MRRRRGLSPLVATVLLISATVLGGILVYQYFQKSVSHAQGLQQSLTLTADSITLNENTTIVRVTIVNQGDDNIIVKKIVLLDENGNTLNSTILQGQTKPLSPGERTVIILKTNKKPSALYAQYLLKGKTYTSEPVEIP